MPVYDLAIIGGGIAGLGVFEAAGRAGLEAVLIERGDLGAATTAVTSGLLHGGLRYLPYDAGTSRLMCGEIARLRRERPELLTRTAFLWPVYRGHRYGLALVESLNEYYDRFSDLRGSPRHVRLSAHEAAQALEGLALDGLRGAVAFEEWSVDVPRLVAALAEAGRAAGGEILERRRLVAFARSGGRLNAAVAADSSGTRAEVAARLFVNAAGPWAEEVARLAGSSAVRLRLRKGAHWVAEGEPPRHGLIFPGPGGRYVGAYPRRGETWVGPTDDPFDGAPDEAAPTEEEAAGLRRALAAVLPDLAARPGRAVAGLRPIPDQAGAAALLSRDHRVLDHAREGIENLLTTAGGKLTTHRPLGEDVIAVACAKLGRPAPARAGADGAWGFLRASRVLGLAASAGMLAGCAALHALRPGRREGIALFRREFE